MATHLHHDFKGGDIIRTYPISDREARGGVILYAIFFIWMIGCLVFNFDIGIWTQILWGGTIGIALLNAIVRWITKK